MNEEEEKFAADCWNKSRLKIVQKYITPISQVQKLIKPVFAEADVMGLRWRKRISTLDESNILMQNCLAAGHSEEWCNSKVKMRRMDYNKMI